MVTSHSGSIEARTSHPGWSCPRESIIYPVHPEHPGSQDWIKVDLKSSSGVSVEPLHVRPRFEEFVPFSRVGLADSSLSTRALPSGIVSRITAFRNLLSTS